MRKLLTFLVFIAFCYVISTNDTYSQAYLFDVQNKAYHIAVPEILYKTTKAIFGLAGRVISVVMTVMSGRFIIIRDSIFFRSKRPISRWIGRIVYGMQNHNLVSIVRLLIRIQMRLFPYKYFQTAYSIQIRLFL